MGKFFLISFGTDSFILTFLISIFGFSSFIKGILISRFDFLTFGILLFISISCFSILGLSKTKIGISIS